MAKYLSNIDLSQNQLLNSVLQNLATAPSNPREGQMYYNTAVKRAYICINPVGPVWQEMDGLGATMTGASIVSAINGSSSLIDDNNLSAAVNSAIAKAHNTHAISDVTGLDTALAGKAATSHNHTLDALSNTTITSNTPGEILKWNGTAWINNTLAEAGIAASSHGHAIADVSGLQTALNGKSDTGHGHAIADTTGLQGALDGKVDDNQVLTNVPAGAIFTDTIYTHPAAHPPSIITQDASNRFVTDAEKATWNAKGSSNLVLGTTSTTAYRGDYGNTAYTHSQAAHAPSNANYYVHPTGDGNLHVPVTSTTNSGKVLKAGATAGSITWGVDNDTVTTINGNTGAIVKADIVALGIPAQDTTYGVFTSTVNGLTPLSGGGTTKYLRADGTWVAPPNTIYTLPVAGASIGGVKSGTDITVDASGNVSVVDDSHNHIISNVDGLQAALDAKETPAGATAKASTAENNAKGYTDTQLAALLDSAPGTLDTLNELAAALGDDPNFATTVANNLAGKTGKYVAAVGNGTLTSFTVTHGRNTRDVAVMIRETAAPYAQVITDVEMTTVDTITVKFAVAPSASQYTVTVVG